MDGLGETEADGTVNGYRYEKIKASQRDKHAKLRSVHRLSPYFLLRGGPLRYRPGHRNDQAHRLVSPHLHPRGTRRGLGSIRSHNTNRSCCQVQVQIHA